MLFEPEIVAFPSGPTDAPSRRESNSAVLLTLIVALVAFVLVVLLPDRVVELIFVLVVLLDVADVTVGVAGGSLNGGALLSGWGLFAPAPANVPVVEPLPPKPV